MPMHIVVRGIGVLAMVVLCGAMSLAQADEDCWDVRSMTCCEYQWNHGGAVYREYAPSCNPALCCDTQPQGEPHRNVRIPGDTFEADDIFIGTTYTCWATDMSFDGNCNCKVTSGVPIPIPHKCTDVVPGALCPL